MTLSLNSFCHFLCTELVQLSQVYGPPCLSMLLQFSPQFSVGLRSGLCEVYFNTDSIFKPFCYNFEYILWIIVLLEDPVVTQVLTLTVLKWCCFSISRQSSLLMIPSLFWRAPVPFPAKHPHNMKLPCLCFTVGMVFFKLNPHIFFFPPYIALIIMTQQFNFYSLKI